MQVYDPVGPPVRVGFVTDGVALKEVYLRVFRLSQFSIILPILSTHSFIYFRYYIFSEPILVAARSKVRVCGSSLVGIEASNPSGGMMPVCCECCQVEVSETGRSLVQRSPTKCGVSEYDCEGSIMRKPWRSRGCCVTVTNIVLAINNFLK